MPPRNAGRVLATYLLLVLAGSALIAPPLYWALKAGGIDESFGGLANRITALVALAGLIVLMRSLRLRGREVWGYGISAKNGLRYVWIGFGLGLLSMGPVIVLQMALGLQVWDQERDSTDLLIAILDGCLAGFGVALIEETIFRGGLQSVVSRAYNAQTAVWTTALLYAIAHLLDYDAKFAEVGWSSGFRFLGEAAATLANADIYGALLTLFLAGALLSLLRVYFGHIYLAIGLHAGWVAAIQWTRKAFDLYDDHRLVWLVSDSYDGIIGYLAASMLAILLVVCWLILFNKSDLQPPRS